MQKVRRAISFLAAAAIPATATLASAPPSDMLVGVVSGIVAAFGYDVLSDMNRLICRRYLDGRHGEIKENHETDRVLREAQLDALRQIANRFAQASAGDTDSRHLVDEILDFIVREQGKTWEAGFGRTPQGQQEESHARDEVLRVLPECFVGVLASSADHRHTDGVAAIASVARLAAETLVLAELTILARRNARIRAHDRDLPEPDLPPGFIKAFRGDDGGPSWFEFFARSAEGQAIENDSFRTVWQAERIAFIETLAKTQFEILNNIEKTQGLHTQLLTELLRELREFVKSAPRRQGQSSGPTPTIVERHITAFLSNASDDRQEAHRYRAHLHSAGSDIRQYTDLTRSGRDAAGVVASLALEISKRDFFLILVSNSSLSKEYSQRELGLARDTAERNRKFRPLIIPVYTSKVDWNKTPTPPEFPTREFLTGDPKEPFALLPEGGFRMHGDSTQEQEELAAYLKPQLLISRIDFVDEYIFDDLEVFELYEDLFPPEERDNPASIKKWVLETDIGETRSVDINDGEVAFTYRPDSRFCILKVGNKAVGLSFLTYDHTYRIMYGNYIAVQESWRSFGLAKYFAAKIKSRFEEFELFSDMRGIVFEVETFDLNEVARIVEYLETKGTKGEEKKFETEEDETQFRRFLRVCMYEGTSIGMGYKFFLNTTTKEPVVCGSPCLEPTLDRAEWEDEEEKYWLMWRGNESKVDVKEIWHHCVECVYIEILAKALVDQHADELGLEYWHYANGVVRRTLANEQNTQMHLGHYQPRKKAELLRRWVALKMRIAI